MNEVTEFLLFQESSAIDKVKLTSAWKRLSVSRADLLAHIREVSKSGNLEAMVQLEKTIIQNDFDKYANSKAMEASLKTALSELDIIQKHFSLVADKQAYAGIDADHALPKNRQKGLPLDEARQAFKSHFARLVNIDKSRLDNDEKRIIDARKTNISAAEKLYTQRQAQTLGVALEAGHKARIKR